MRLATKVGPEPILIHSFQTKRKLQVSVRRIVGAALCVGARLEHCHVRRMCDMLQEVLWTLESKSVAAIVSKLRCRITARFVEMKIWVHGS